MTHSSLKTYLGLVLIALFSVSCSFFSTIKSQKKETAPVKYGNRFEVYYGAQTVGWCDYVVRKVEYSATDADLEESFVEEISFRKLRYKFKFIMFGELTELHLLRYNSNGTQFRANDSFAIILNGEGLSYRFFSDDGEKVIREVPIRDDDKVAAAKELFTFCNRYLNSYLLFINDKKSRDLRNNRIQSLGFELLQYDRI
jgi:hypothetical protein